MVGSPPRSQEGAAGAHGPRPSGRSSVAVAAAIEGRRLVALALRLALEVDAIGVVDDAIKDGVRDRWLRKHSLPRCRYKAISRRGLPPSEISSRPQPPCRSGTAVPPQPKRGRLWLTDGSCVSLRTERADHVRSYDWVHHRSHDGQPFRTLNGLDEFTLESPVRRQHLPCDIGNATRDPVGSGLQWIVRQVRVSRGCLHLVMTEQFSDHGKSFPD